MKFLILWSFLAFLSEWQKGKKREFCGRKSTLDGKFSRFGAAGKNFVKFLDKNTHVPTNCADISSWTSNISLHFWKNFTKTVNFFSDFQKISWKNQKLHLETPPSWWIFQWFSRFFSEKIDFSIFLNYVWKFWAQIRDQWRIWADKYSLLFEFYRIN